MAKQYRVVVEGTPYEVTFLQNTGSSVRFAIGGVEYDVALENTSRILSGHSPSPSAITPPPPAAAPTATKGRDPGVITAPMPGLVVSVQVEKGQEVQVGEEVAVLEAMKMENGVTTSQAGTVQEICVNAGEQVEAGTVLIRLSSEDTK
jgi:biotin carboxyl carrier protein